MLPQNKILAFATIVIPIFGLLFVKTCLNFIIKDMNIRRILSDEIIFERFFERKQREEQLHKTEYIQ